MCDNIDIFAGIPDLESIYMGPNFERPFHAVINSHQTRYPMLKQAWVQNTLNAIDSLMDSRPVLPASAGLNNHELALWYAGHVGLSQIVVLPVPNFKNKENHRQTILNDFDLEPDRTGFLFFRSSSTRRKSRHRDRLILDLADRVIPVSVRPRGTMGTLLRGLSDTVVDRRFETPFDPHPYPLGIPEVNARLLPDSKCSWLTHWTRRFHGPFPDETPAAYYRSILENPDEYSHSAFHSLARILEKQTIYAATHGIRGGYEMTSFTRLPPSRAVQMMKWHPARVRFTFEPYGIAIHGDVLRDMGARPVIYGGHDEFTKLPAPDRPYHQYRGKHGEWVAEEEWRVKGDVNLSGIPKNRIIVLAANKQDACRLSRKYGEYEILPLS